MRAIVIEVLPQPAPYSSTDAPAGSAITLIMNPIASNWLKTAPGLFV